MYGATSHAFPTFLLVYPSQFIYKHLYPNECPRLGNVQMRSCRVGKCEREDKTGHEKYDIRLLKNKKQKNHYCIRAEQVGSGTFRPAIKRPRL